MTSWRKLGHLIVVAMTGLMLTTAPGPRVAHAAELPKSFESLPVDAQIVFLIPSMSKLSEKLKLLNEQAELGNEWMNDALAELKRAMGMNNGLNNDGAFALVITNVGSFGKVEQPPVLMMAGVLDYGAFIKNYDGDPIDEIATLHMPTGQKAFAKKVDGFAVISAQEAAIDTFQMGGERSIEKFTDLAGAVGADTIAQSDFVVFIDMLQASPTFGRTAEEYLERSRRAIDDTLLTDASRKLNETVFNIAQNTVKAVLRDGSSAVIGIDLTAAGIGVTTTLQFEQSSAMGKIFTDGGGVRSGLVRIPHNSYVTAQSLDFRGIDIKAVVKNALAEFRLVGRNPWIDLANAVAPLLTDIKSVGHAFFLAEEIGIGTNLFSSVGVLETSGSAQYMATAKQAFDRLKEMNIELGALRNKGGVAVAGQEAGAISIDASYNSNALAIQGAAVDFYSIRYSLPSQIMGLISETTGILMMLGGASQTGYLAGAGNSVIVTTTTEAQLVKESLTSLENSRGLGIDSDLMTVRQTLGEDPSGEMFINVAGIARNSNQFAKLIARENAETFALPEATDVLPIGMSYTVKENGIRLRGFIPMNTARYGMKANRAFKAYHEKKAAEKEAAQAEAAAPNRGTGNQTRSQPRGRPPVANPRGPVRQRPGAGPPPGAGQPPEQSGLGPAEREARERYEAGRRR